VDHFLRVVAAGAREHGHAAARLCDDELDDLDLFGVGQRWDLARRAARHQEVNAQVDLPPGKPGHSRLVE